MQSKVKHFTLIFTYFIDLFCSIRSNDWDVCVTLPEIVRICLADFTDTALMFFFLKVEEV